MAMACLCTHRLVAYEHIVPHVHDHVVEPLMCSLIFKDLASTRLVSRTFVRIMIPHVYRSTNCLTAWEMQMSELLREP